MKQFLFAAALVAASASVGFADDKPATGAAATPATPVVVAGTPLVVESAPAAPARRGLFGRLRNRNTSTTAYSTPLTTTTVPMTGAAPMPAVAPPQAMPAVKPSGAMVVPGTLGGVVQATGTLPAGTYTTTDGTIVQIGAMQPMTTPTERRGLFSRLRNR